MRRGRRNVQAKAQCCIASLPIWNKGAGTFGWPYHFYTILINIFFLFGVGIVILAPNEHRGIMLRKPPVGGTVFLFVFKKWTWRLRSEDDTGCGKTSDFCGAQLINLQQWETKNQAWRTWVRKASTLSVSHPGGGGWGFVSVKESLVLLDFLTSFFTKLCFCFGKHRRWVFRFFSLFIVMHIFLQLSWHNFSNFFISPNSSSVLLYKMYISPHNLCLPCQWTPEIWKVYPLLVALSPISENLPSRHCSN